MRTDAMLFGNVGSSEQSGFIRMDHVRNRNQIDKDMGFGKENQNTQSVRFRETYDKIANANSKAHKETDTTIKAKDFQKRPEENSQRNNSVEKNVEKDVTTDSSRSPVDKRDVDTDQSVDTQYQEHDTIESKNAVENAERVDDVTKKAEEEGLNVKEATGVIIDALQSISEIMKLNIAPGLESVNLDSIDEQTIDQFAEIVHAVKSIIGALEMAKNDNQSIVTDAMVIDKQSADEITKKLQSELFRFEMGINMLGKSDEVHSAVAQKMGLTPSSGIPQAIDPAQLSMNTEQLKEIFDDVFNVKDKSSEISQLVKKVNEMVNDKSQKLTESNVVHLSSEKAETIETVPFDAKMYRAMLKIDTPDKKQVEKVSAENVSAAEKTIDLKLPAADNGVLARDIKEPLKMPEQVLPVTELTSKSGHIQNNSIHELKSALNMSKALENSVMNQVHEKLNTAIRAGMNEIRIQLRPEALGEITLRIRVEGDVVVARMQVENQQVKAIVENNLQFLKDSLAQHNLQAGSFDVDVQTGGREQDLSDPFFGNKSGGKNAGASENDNGQSDNDTSGEISKEETGKRYGNNTIEYIA
jgi:flagellar hook-length control protein FliK